MRASRTAAGAILVLAGRVALLAGPAEDYVDAQLRVVKGLEEQVPALARLADKAATRLLDGGKLYLAGDGGMVRELYVRAGGLCATHILKPDVSQVTPKDIVLYSDYGSPRWEDHPWWRAVRGRGESVIAFVSKEHELLKKLADQGGHAVCVDIPMNSGLIAHSGRVVPTAPPAIAIAQWAFVAELIGACRRQGKQPAVYLSIHLDEGRKRFDRTKGLVFEPDLKPEPAPAGHFAKEFLAHVRAALEAVRRDEAEKMRTAGAWLREAKAAGKNLAQHLHGHLPPSQSEVRGAPGLFTHTFTSALGKEGGEFLGRILEQGSVCLLVGYQQNEDAMAAAANKAGLRTIFITALGPGPEQAKSPLHLYVNPHWPLTDGCLALPGYDVKACPLSGIMGLTAYHAICAEAVAGK